MESVLNRTIHPKFHQLLNLLDMNSFIEPMARCKKEALASTYNEFLNMSLTLSSILSQHKKRYTVSMGKEILNWAGYTWQMRQVPVPVSLYFSFHIIDCSNQDCQCRIFGKRGH